MRARKRANASFAGRTFPSTTCLFVSASTFRNANVLLRLLISCDVVQHSFRLTMHCDDHWLPAGRKLANNVRRISLEVADGLCLF